MKKLVFSLLFLVAFSCLLASSANAQGAYYYSQISYDDDSSLVSGYSATEIDYSTSWYYNAAVDAYLYDEYGNLLDCGTDQEPNFAEVDTVTYGDPGTDYRLDTYNYEVDIYYYVDIEREPEGCMPCDGCNTDCYYYYENWYWYDPFGFSFSPYGYYDSWWYSYGYGPPTYIEDDEYNEKAESHDWAAAYKVNISAAQTVNDGDSPTFSVNITGNVTANNYAWSFTAPSGAGNNPNVTFSTPNARSTNSDAHWFALPDDMCNAATNSTYTIKCRVDLSNGKHKDLQTQLTVSVAFNGEPGYTEGVTITGGPRHGFDTSRNLWLVIDKGTMARAAAVPHVNIPSTSQFYNKAVAHENQHVANYNTGGVLGDLWTVDGLFSLLSPLTDSSEGGLLQQIVDTLHTWDANQTTIFNSRKRADEQAAYAASDPIGPQYLGMWRCQQSRYP